MMGDALVGAFMVFIGVVWAWCAYMDYKYPDKKEN